MTDEIKKAVTELVEKGLSGQKKSVATIIASVISIMMILMLAINMYFVKAWMSRVEVHGVDSQRQMQSIMQDIKSIELKLTVLNSTLVDHTEVRRMIQEYAEPHIKEAIRAHEKEFHLK
jgi:hypothetical protein